MDLKKIEKATKTLKLIKAIDKEIIEIEAHAISILNNEFRISFSINMEPVSETEKPTINKKIASDFSDAIDMMMKKGYGIPHFGFGGDRNTNAKKDNHSIAKNINDTTALSMLGVFICEKNKERLQLLNELELLGVNIKN